MIIKSDGGEVEIEDVKICDELEKLSGLMFIPREKARALLFDFKKPVKKSIHSFFLFFPFMAVWLDDKSHIIEIKTVKPFRFTIQPKKPFYQLLEIPVNQKYKKILRALEDK
jgi:uncharacterized membrane protein (UPF0127 family)